MRVKNENYKLHSNITLIVEKPLPLTYLFPVSAKFEYKFCSINHSKIVHNATSKIQGNNLNSFRNGILIS